MEWAPDGEKIVYGLKKNQEIYNPEIYRLNKDGTENKKIENGSKASWSSDGKSILILGDIEKSLDEDLSYSKNPKFSPDGKRIAFERGRDIFIMNSDGSQQEKTLIGFYEGY